jgi:hypothetical protein
MPGMRFSFLRAMAVIVCVLTVSAGSAYAADIGDKDIQMDQVYYQPALMPSVQDAVNALNALHSSYSDWRGGLPEGVYATPASVLIHTNIHSTQDGSQWVPNWGGSFVGGSYVPYMGGSMQSTHSESDSPADVAVTPKEIDNVTLWNYPNLERDFKFGFDLGIVHDGKPSTMSFRTANIEIARQLGNAFATLAAVNFTNGTRFMPSVGFIAKGKDLAADYARLNWMQPTGVLVDIVLQGSPAAAAGLAHDDIIFEVSGKPVATPTEFRRDMLMALGGKLVGEVEIKVFRGGQTIPVKIAVNDPNAGIEKLLPAPPPPPALPPPAKLGIAARNMAPTEAAKAKRPSGVVVVGVDVGSLGQQLGLANGDILIEINGQAIADLDAMKKALASGSVDIVKVLRKGKPVTLNGISKM